MLCKGRTIRDFAVYDYIFTVSSAHDCLASTVSLMSPRAGVPSSLVSGGVCFAIDDEIVRNAWIVEAPDRKINEAQ